MFGELVLEVAGQEVICLRNMEAAEMLGGILNVKFQSLRFCFLKWKIRQ